MFIGHYAPALALKPAAPQVPLWVLFVSVQLLDVAWACLVLAGVERAGVAPEHFLAPMAFEHFPYSHSLTALALWAGGAGLLAAFVWRRHSAAAAALVVALAVASHWLFDLPMHRGDLPLWPGGPTVGFGLLDYPAVAIALELSIVSAGFFLYSRATRPNGPIGEFAPAIAAIVLIFAFGVHVLSPGPDNDRHLAWMALVTFAVFAALAAWLDHTRSPREPSRLTRPHSRAT